MGLIVGLIGAVLTGVISPFGIETGGFALASSITAVYQGPFGGLACPSDASVTPETRGDLTATLTSGGIAGQYTEVYGSGPDSVTFHFVIQAHLNAP